MLGKKEAEEEATKDATQTATKKPHSKKSKNLKITETIRIKRTDVPEGWTSKGSVSYIVQDIQITVRNIEFRRERWLDENGKIVVEELPEEYRNGGHFGPTLRTHIINELFVKRVPQEKLRQCLLDMGIEISAGQISNIVATAGEQFTKEYEDIAEAGIQTSKVVNTDDTGARHGGKNGSTNVICNDLFALFTTTNSKSRINFLEILANSQSLSYVLNDDAFEYIEKHPLPQATHEWLISQEKTTYSEEKFVELLASCALTPSSQKTITQACLYAFCIANGLRKDTIILSDGAGQFKLFDNHALCWVHAVRAFKKIIPINGAEAKEIELLEDIIWSYYKSLHNYQQNPSSERKKTLSRRFDIIFSSTTKSQSLPAVLKGFMNKKAELLLVLEHPYVPLHNNTAERDLRHAVIQRKISGGTRSEKGRKARDIFFTLFKTCQKNGISIIKFLEDRMKNINNMPNLGDVIRQRNAQVAAASPP